MTRRDMLRNTALAGAALVARGGIAMKKPVQRLTAFPHSQVSLAGELRTQLDQAIHTLMQLDDDSLLFPIRKMNGLPAPGETLGGWYAADGFAPAHCLGQWMSSLARYTAATEDAAAQQKLHRIVQSLHETLQHGNKGFFHDNHFPAYTYDKLLLGLMDAHSFTGVPQARPCMALLSQRAEPFLPAAAKDRDELCSEPKDPIRYCIDEPYTLPENQWLAWKLTGDPRYQGVAERLLVSRQFFFPLAQGENKLVNQHAYSHMNALSSAAQTYLVLGDDRYLQAARNGFAFAEQQSFATGGWGPEEAFVNPATDRLVEGLATTHRGFETPCGCYAHLKLARYLLCVTGDPHYGDSMERILYNTVAGALPLQADGRAFYHSDYNWSASKTYFPDRWPCCAGTLPMVASDYGINAYFRGIRGLWVNLYLPSTLQFTTRKGTRVKLTQQGGYPKTSDVDMTLELSRPAKFALRLRVPAWCENANLRVNDRRVDALLSPGTFATVEREWEHGDRVELDLPLRARVEPLSPQHPETVALMRGPLCLFATGAEAGKTFSRAELLQAANGNANFRSFGQIGAVEPYSLYVRLKQS